MLFEAEKGLSESAPNEKPLEEGAEDAGATTGAAVGTGAVTVDEALKGLDENPLRENVGGAEAAGAGGEAAGVVEAAGAPNENENPPAGVDEDRAEDFSVLEAGADEDEALLRTLEGSNENEGEDPKESPAVGCELFSFSFSCCFAFSASFSLCFTTSLSLSSFSLVFVPAAKPVKENSKPPEDFGADSEVDFDLDEKSNEGISVGAEPNELLELNENKGAEEVEDEAGAPKENPTVEDLVFLLEDSAPSSCD